MLGNINTQLEFASQKYATVGSCGVAITVKLATNLYQVIANNLNAPSGNAVR